MYKRGNFMSELLTRIYDYLEEIKDNDKEFYNDVNTFLLSINNSQIPKIFPKYEDAFMNFNEKNMKRDTIMMLTRSFCQSVGYYGIVTENYCKELKDYIGDKKVLEVMSGRGFLAKGLAEQGVFVKATDDLSWPNMKDPLTEIDNISAIEAIKKHGKDFDILLISWPPYNDYAINEAIQHWGAKKEILYIGEDDGCCANEEFFKMIKMKKSNIKQPQFSGMHDNLYHCHLKNKYDLTLKSSSKNKIS